MSSNKNNSNLNNIDYTSPKKKENSSFEPETQVKENLRSIINENRVSLANLFQNISNSLNPDSLEN